MPKTLRRGTQCFVIHAHSGAGSHDALTRVRGRPPLRIRRARGAACQPACRARRKVVVPRVRNHKWRPNIRQRGRKKRREIAMNSHQWLYSYAGVNAAKNAPHFLCVEMIGQHAPYKPPWPQYFTRKVFSMTLMSSSSSSKPSSFCVQKVARADDARAGACTCAGPVVSV